MPWATLLLQSGIFFLLTFISSFHCLFSLAYKHILILPIEKERKKSFGICYLPLPFLATAWFHSSWLSFLNNGFLDLFPTTLSPSHCPMASISPSPPPKPPLWPLNGTGILFLSRPMGRTKSNVQYKASLKILKVTAVLNFSCCFAVGVVSSMNISLSSNRAVFIYWWWLVLRSHTLQARYWQVILVFQGYLLSHLSSLLDSESLEK